MKYLSCAVLIAATTVVASAQNAPNQKKDDKIQPQPVTLTGCVAAGIRKNTFLLTHVYANAPVGTAGTDAAAEVVYWLDSSSKLKGRVGHRVRITGTLDDDVDKTNVKVKDGKVELVTEHTKKVEVVDGTPAAAAVKAVGTSGQRTTYKVKVDTLTTISRSCS